MYLRFVLVWLRRLVIISAILCTSYLYLYPVIYACAFPSTTGLPRDGFKHTIDQHRGLIDDDDASLAPFRLLVLADPQLEGDSSLPDPEDALRARIGFHWSRLRQSPQHELKDALGDVVKELVLEDIPRAFWAVRKTLDLFGNDYYLAHIYRTLYWWSIPTHVTVLGDLIGSQWVSDDEFVWRAWRYWNRMLAGSEKVDEEIMNMYQQEKDKRHNFALGRESLGYWSRKVINIAGNHDIGYAGDISRSRMERFEQAFGKANWDIKFSYPEERVPEARKVVGLPVPEIHLIVLNSMLLDTPVLDGSLQRDTYGYINDLISQRLDSVESRNNTFTLLLTHVPLHKPESVCVDSPFVDFWDFEDADGAFKHGGLREQNHLSEHTSHNGILRSIYGMSGDQDVPVGGRGRKGLILNGHDHEGCDTVHYIERTTLPSSPDEVQEQKTLATEEETSSHEADVTEDLVPQDIETLSWQWRSIPHPKFVSSNTFHSAPESSSEIVTSLREITLRSMMGEYSGNAGLLSLWYDFDAGHWDYEIMMCPLGVQHTWWAIHVLDLVATVLVVAQFVSWLSMRFTNKATSADARSIDLNIRDRRLVEGRPTKQAKQRAGNTERQMGRAYQTISDKHDSDGEEMAADGQAVKEKRNGITQHE